MKMVKVTEPEATLLALLEQARHEDIVVQLADGQEFVLSAIDDFDYEIARTRKNAALMALLDERAKESATIDLATVKSELGIE